LAETKRAAHGGPWRSHPKSGFRRRARPACPTTARGSPWRRAFL
jgi:hypothetical protein